MPSMTTPIIRTLSRDVTHTDMRRLRGLLAEHRISHTALADAAGLERTYVSRVLCGTRPCGEKTAIKLGRALAALGINPPEGNAGGDDDGKP